MTKNIEGHLPHQWDTPKTVDTYRVRCPRCNADRPKRQHTAKAGAVVVRNRRCRSCGYTFVEHEH